MARQWLVTFLKLIKFNINKQWVQDVVMRKFRFYGDEKISISIFNLNYFNLIQTLQVTLTMTS